MWNKIIPNYQDWLLAQPFREAREWMTQVTCNPSMTGEASEGSSMVGLHFLLSASSAALWACPWGAGARLEQQEVQAEGLSCRLCSWAGSLGGQLEKPDFPLLGLSPGPAKTGTTSFLPHLENQVKPPNLTSRGSSAPGSCPGLLQSLSSQASDQGHFLG